MNRWNRRARSFFETTPLQTIQDNLGRLISTGLPIYISEFDVNIANDQDQLEKYKQLFPIWWEHPAVKGVTLWDISKTKFGGPTHIFCGRMDLKDLP
ncbi:MAG: endo-1,4-beta-xylanase [Saprospiraceae bacterium]|nr:endo-1,4-beta-xylanase [Saprospiraceae bacterium]